MISQIIEVKYRPQQLGQKEYHELGLNVSLMLRVCKNIYGTGKAVVLCNGFCVAKVITNLEFKGVYAVSLIKSWCY